VEEFGDIGLVVLNGRSKSDTPANYTYVDGKSIIDLAWSTLSFLDYVLDFCVDTFSLSDHYPCCITLKLVNDDSRNSVNWRPKIIVHSEMKDEFQNNLTAGEDLSLDEIKKVIVNSCKALRWYKDGPFKPRASQVWFDEECSVAYRDLKFKCSQLRSGYSQVNVDMVKTERRRYRNLINSKKRDYYEIIQESLSKCKSSSTFWGTIKRYRKRTNQMCQLGREQWESFYERVMPVRQELDIIDILPVIEVEVLDCPFSLATAHAQLHA